ncbi:hypothetical protein GOBAR_DD32946 [Gossypium barbadense]|nr:hypothetical protein GOBAR_DD32946 [Gossypium barbadense]
MDALELTIGNPIGPSEGLKEFFYALASCESELQQYPCMENGEWGGGAMPNGLPFMLVCRSCSYHPQIFIIGANLRKTEPKFKWKPPPKGFLKFNVDGSFSKQQAYVGIGSLCRDNRGVGLIVFSKSVKVRSAV